MLNQLPGKNVKVVRIDKTDYIIALIPDIGANAVASLSGPCRRLLPTVGASAHGRLIRGSAGLNSPHALHIITHFIPPGPGVGREGA